MSKHKLIPNTFALKCIADSSITWPQQQNEFDKNQPYIVVGEGSNILLLDESFHGQLIQVSNNQFVVSETPDTYIVELGGGLNWHKTVVQLLEQGINGAENLALIPGTVGAAPVQNIGAYGVEIAQFVHAIEAYDVQLNKIVKFNNDDCQFAYRDSIFKHQTYQGKSRFIIETVWLKFSKGAQVVTEYGPLKQFADDYQRQHNCCPTASSIFDEVCRIRQSKLPNPHKLANAGSFFKNPIVEQNTALQLQQQVEECLDMPIYPYADNLVKLAAGFLIDKAGLKGYAVNDAQVHQLQALVLTNKGSARGADIALLAKKVCDKVNHIYAIELQPEVRFISSAGEVDAVSYLNTLLDKS
ncbi:UDP-N-acetylenolpyruvoylglucosamine reductase [Catenovulum agarivorans DS-2]|uniref:UDP-N-acetylenolpyruvoylglucosamine reductase n=1 Tax=Catenovulum agarivorans DS-2 TaxID=1328313 RepID=W7QRU6_9ALTE|nr:UDP-N-acetylmuramate dehydrogenase [Catenovulum agarivorans]EWH08125.1 UDP-N-acetylenolpyruvoylglucosamine reductase [Catenovulum agarivorans DS-2]